MSVTEPKPYRVFPSVLVPIVLSDFAYYLGFTRDYWLLCCILFIVLGSICEISDLRAALRHGRIGRLVRP
jgi:hypothetical protein